MCEVAQKIERTPALARLLVEIRQALKDALDACNNPEPKEARNGTTDVRPA